MHRLAAGGDLRLGGERLENVDQPLAGQLMPGFAACEQQRTELILTDDVAALDRADQVVAHRTFAHTLCEHFADDVAGGYAEAE